MAYFGKRYFAPRFYGPRYFGKLGALISIARRLRTAIRRGFGAPSVSRSPTPSPRRSPTPSFRRNARP